jgi:hypothetical protein
MWWIVDQGPLVSPTPAHQAAFRRSYSARGKVGVRWAGDPLTGPSRVENPGAVPRKFGLGFLVRLIESVYSTATELTWESKTRQTGKSRQRQTMNTSPWRYRPCATVRDTSQPCNTLQFRTLIAQLLLQRPPIPEHSFSGS